MSPPTYNWPNNPPPTSSFDIPAEDRIVKSGIYNRSVLVPIAATGSQTGSAFTSSIFWATGSNQGVIAVLVKSGNFDAYLSAGGVVSGSYLDAGVIHDLGVKKVVNKEGGEVTILWNVR